MKCVAGLCVPGGPATHRPPVGGSAAAGLTRNASDGNFEVLMDFAQAAIYSLLWYSYFQKSVRVQNTYVNVAPVPQPQGVVS